MLISKEVTIDSLATADDVLRELGRLRREMASIEIRCQEKIEVLKKEFADKAVIEIDGIEVRLADRCEQLEKLLCDWTVARIGEHLPKDKRSIELTAGRLGLRKIAQQIAIAEGEDGQPYKPKDVLDWIMHSGWIPKPVQKELVKVAITPSMTGAKKALEAGKLTVDDLWQVGIDVIDEHDVPVVEPAEIAVNGQ